MRIEKVGVVGGGVMGHGIAQVVASAGYEVVLREVDEAILGKAVGKIEKGLARAVEKGKATQEESDAIRGRILGTTDYDALAGCQLVVEAITEDLGLKVDMWKVVDGLLGPDAVLATNTSSLPVIAQAAATSRPERFLGLHFFNPAQVMALVEVIRCVTTSDETFEAGLEFGRSLGKMVVPTRDRAGFVVNRLLVPYMLDAIRGYEEGIGTISDIDAAMKAGAGHPMGPLALCDLVGLDTLGMICTGLYEEYRETRFAAPPTLRKMLAAGWYGRKSGLGFYDYSGADPVPNPGLAPTL